MSYGSTAPRGSGEYQVEVDRPKEDAPLLGDTPDGKQEREVIRKADWGRLLSLAKPEWLILTIGTVALFLGSLTTLVIPMAAGIIVDAVVGEGESRFSITDVIVFLALAFIFGAICTALRATLFTLAGERVVARMRKDLFANVMKQEIGFFDTTRTGELTNRLASDTMVMQNAVTVNISMALRYIAQAIGSMILLFVISWNLTLVMLATVPVVVLGAVAYGLFLKKLAKRTQDALARASEVAEEALSNIRTVRSFAKEHYETERYGAEVDESYRLGKLKSYALGGFAGAATLCVQFSFGLVLLYGGYLVSNDEMTAGALTAFLMYTLSVAMSLGGMSVLYGDFMKAIGASARVFELTDRVPKVHYTGGMRPSSLEGKIALQDVHFSYPSRPDQAVLQGLDLQLQPGHVVALVGPSGAGKTTIANLIEMFYYPEKGRVILDGRDLRDYDPKWLHENVGVVEQLPCLFATSIAKNIAYGLGDNVPMDKIMQAAREAHAHDFITGFREGYETMVGERGVRLSGGQKQRIAIARALLKDPSILLLDEATSNLDSESEHLVQKALDALMKGRTVLVIAHRLSTVRNATNIVVMKDGRVAEQGTHEQLMEQEGIYVQLVSRQLQSS